MIATPRPKTVLIDQPSPNGSRPPLPQTHPQTDPPSPWREKPLPYPPLHPNGETLLERPVFEREYIRFAGTPLDCVDSADVFVPGSHGWQRLSDPETRLLLAGVGPERHAGFLDLLARRARRSDRPPVDGLLLMPADVDVARIALRKGFVKLLCLTPALALALTGMRSIADAARWLACRNPGASVICAETGFVHAAHGKTEYTTWLRPGRGHPSDDPGESTPRAMLNSAFAAAALAESADDLAAPTRQALLAGRANRAALERAGTDDHGYTKKQIAELLRDLPAWPPCLLHLEARARRR